MLTDLQAGSSRHPPDYVTAVIDPEAIFEMTFTTK